ncbi:hypothetical protein NDU88_007177 [Pleurodeles waltl]|uniref:Uncharacterized protein n=1 Tax=Pleurodeles waltl TaxID=8319 RepID=A0AAV7RQZ3_PLEWA|nr:hypothetical protein NDU88_007177 [Pleurodeles waltl]
MGSPCCWTGAQGAKLSDWVQLVVARNYWACRARHPVTNLVDKYWLSRLEGGILSSSIETSLMGKSKRPAQLQGNTMELYTTPAPSVQRETCLTRCMIDVGLDDPVVEPMRAKLLAAIEGGTQRKDRISGNEAQSPLGGPSGANHGGLELRAEVDTLRKKMAEVTSRAGTLDDRESAGKLELSPEGGASQTRVEIQEDGTMGLTHRDVTIDSMETAVAEEAAVVGTDTCLYIC